MVCTHSCVCVSGQTTAYDLCIKGTISGQTTTQVHKPLDNIDLSTLDTDVEVNIRLSSSGCIHHHDGSLGAETKRRISKVSTACGRPEKSLVQQRSENKNQTSCLLTSLLYASKTWTQRFYAAPTQ